MYEILLANGTVIQSDGVSAYSGGVLYLFDALDDGGTSWRMTLAPGSWLSYRRTTPPEPPVIDATPFESWRSASLDHEQY